MECQLSSRLYPEGGGEMGEEKGGYVGHREFVWVLSSSFLHFLAFPPHTLMPLHMLTCNVFQLLCLICFRTPPKAHNSVLRALF